MAPKIAITIMVDEQGNIAVHSQTPDKVYTIGLLELAKHAIVMQKPEAESRIVKPSFTMPNNGN
jgi:hypothetical protein